VNVRLIAATNRSLKDAVQTGSLRQDLMYRLAVFPIRVPPLRERGNDTELLANHFLDELNREAATSKRFSRSALEQLHHHRWLVKSKKRMMTSVKDLFQKSSGRFLD
jgi:transcriptional regulator with GAF, ATPase, and Fis domain